MHKFKWTFLKKRRQKNAAIFFVFGILFCIIITIAYNSGFFYQASVNAYVQADKIFVNSKVQSIVKKLYIKQYEHVKKGQLLIEFDPTLILQDKNKISANIAVFNKQILTVEAEIKSNKYKALALEAEKKSVTSMLTATRERLKGLKILADKGYVSRDTYLIVDGQYNSLISQENKYENETISVESIEQSLMFRQQEIRNKIKSEEAEMLKMNYMLNNMKIYAPISGYVGQVYLTTGQSVSVNDPICIIFSGEHCSIIAEFTGDQISKIKVGQKASIKIQSYPNMIFEGRVSKIAPANILQIDYQPGIEKKQKEINYNYFDYELKLYNVLFNINIKPSEHVILRTGMNAVVMLKD